MSDLLDDLKNKWENARPESSERSSSAETISLAKKKMKSVLYGHYGNIAILTITLIGISAFFVYVAPLQHTLSHVGIFLMLGGLLLRILIECYSILRSSKVDMSDATAIVNEKTLAFYAYRKRIHGPVTIGILAAYTIGFYMLTPEFANYLTTAQVVIMDISYLGAAAIFGYSIRRAIRDEMRLLGELRGLQDELEEG